MSTSLKFFYASSTKSRLIFQLYTLLFITITAFCEVIPPSAIAKQGAIIGYYKTSPQNRVYSVFEGIPYAQPPVGDLRFEEPKPPEPWAVMWATETESVCTQYVDAPLDENGQEIPVENRVVGKDDCLYLNIIKPIIPYRNKTMPVVFMIHGGSFQHGSGGPFSENNIYLPDQDMIFVTFNYRVGIQGFLSTEDKVLPGNLGLKDQSMALKWISENIEGFEGDPKKIIIIGFGAGSSSVQYHHLSPLSRGLFNASIAFSGTVYNPWGFARNASEKARQLGDMFNCPTNNSKKMINCLKKVPEKDLAMASKEFHYWQFMPEAPFAPVIEKAGSRPFINKSPEDIVKANEFYSVPSIFGVVSEEGCDPGAAYASHDNLMQDLNDNWLELAPHVLQYNYTLNKKLFKEVATEARNMYFGPKNITSAVSSELIRLLTDVHYDIGIEKGVRLHAKGNKNSTYFYYYSFQASRSRSRNLSHKETNYGVCHADDFLLVFDDKKPYMKNTIEMDMINFLLNMLGNLINDGKPNLDVKWEPVNYKDSSIKYLHISDPYNYKMVQNSNFGNKKFWGKYFNLKV